MSPSLINLMAIAVFGMTLSVLLGPLLGIPQEGVAIATLGILGIFTTDAFAFSGRGLSVLQDWLNRRDPQFRERLTYHEAGHFLVAHLLDIPVTGYTLSAWDALRQGYPGQGGVRFDDSALQIHLAEGQLPASILNRYCQVWMAGGAAEQVLWGDVQGAKDDLQIMRILWQQMGRSDQDCRLQQRWAALQARTLLEQHRDLLDIVATALASAESVEMCQAKIARSLVGATTAATLAG
jgi:hypothetical protein